MSPVAAWLLFTVVALCALRYWRTLREHRRFVRIASMRLVKETTTTPTNGVRRAQLCVESFPQPPGPIPWPVVGNLVTLGKYEVPFVGLTELAKVYGPCYQLTLGSTRCLVVNNLELIREVLNQNGKFFGGRPDFLRFHTLFGGDRANCEYYISMGLVFSGYF